MTTARAPRGLAAAAGRGAVVTFAGQIARILIQLGGIVLLARMLSPEDYGLTAMVLAIIGVANILRDFGLSSAAIQAKTVTPGQRANLFWINAAIGAVLTGIVAALAVPIAGFYDDPRLVGVTLALSVTFLLNGVATQFRADLNRTFRFGNLALIEIVSQALALGVALGMAAMGWGYWALVAQQVLFVAFEVLALPVVGGWWPGLPRRGEPMRQFLTFGGGVVASQVLTYMSRNVDSVVIGRSFGAVDLGFYNRAFQLMLLPLNQINAPSSRVALPTLSRLQEQPERYRQFLSFGQRVLLNIVSLILGFSLAQAPAVVLIALGPQWSETVPLFQILAIAGFFQAASFVSYWVFLSEGLTTWLFWYTLATRPIMIAIIVAGALGGVHGVAWAYTLSVVVMWPLGMLWLSRKSTASMGHLFLNGLRTLAVYGVAAGASWVSTQGIDPEAPFLQVLVGLVVFVAVLAAALVVPAFRRDVQEIVAGRRHFLGRSRGRKNGAVETAPEDRAGEDAADDHPRKDET